MSTPSSSAPSFKESNFSVPSFPGTVEGYKEWRQKIEIHARRMKARQQGTIVGLDILTSLSGRAWTTCEDLDMDKLETEDGYKLILARLDAIYKHDKRTELPEEFETFFFKGNRRQKETLLDYSSRFRQTYRKLESHDIVLPPNILGWLYMRRAGLSPHERTLILSQVGENLDLDTIEKAMKLTLGLDTLPKQHSNSYVLQDWSEMYEALDSLDEHIEQTYYGHDYDNDHHEPEHYDYETYDQYEPEYEEAYYEEDDGYDYYEDTEESYYEVRDDEPVLDHDPEVYDQIMAAYTDARKKMNDMRLARGFYPVVAMIPSGLEKGEHRGPPKGKGKGKSKGKGKGKGKGKSRGKGKGKKGRKGPSSKGPPSKGRTFTPKEDIVCLRCGQTGHYANECPSAPRKRQRPEGEGVTMMAAPNVEHDESSMAVLDGGATSLMAGYDTIYRYLDKLRSRGYNLKSILTFSCQKTFRFGNDAVSTATTAIMLPMFFGKQFGEMLVYIVPGGAPILIARPIMETWVWSWTLDANERDGEMEVG